MNLRTEIVRLKVERANKHIADLQADIQDFFATNPYPIIGERDPNTRQPIYKLGVCSEPPDRFSLITGDALQNLRSALDHLVWQLVEAAGNTPTSATAFPICKTLAEYQSSSTARKLKGTTKLAEKAIDATKPYGGGNDALWKLHRLNNVDKHRLLITVGGAFRHIDLAPVMLQHATEAFKDSPLGRNLISDLTFNMPFRPADRMFPLKQGDEFFRALPDAEFNKDIKFAFDVAFGEPGVAEGEPLLETLKSLSDLVDTLISGFDSLLA